VLPTETLPKATLAGLVVSAPGMTPVAVTAMLRFEFAAVETMEMPPATAPADAGVKVTPKVELCPAPSVRGKLSPLMFRPAPVTTACEMVALVPPELVRFTVWV
jgi:hypothetical protein